MLHFDTIDVSEGNDVNKTNKLKEYLSLLLFFK